MSHLLERPSASRAPRRHRVDASTRRGFLGGSLSVAALLALSACGASSDAATDAASAASTVDVDTINGTVEIPSLPTAVLATSFEIVTALVDLGVKPIATTSYIPSFGTYTDAVKGLPVIDDATSGELDLEKIASLSPDVILGSDWLAKADRQQPYAKLTAIAPTALFEWKQAAGNWRTEATGVAGALGRQEQLAALEKAYADRCTEMRKTYADLFASTTFDIVTYTAGQPNWYLYSKASSHGQVMADIGMRFGAAADQKAGYAEMSLERFDVLDSTGVVIAGGPGTQKALAKQEAFTSLPAAREGHVYPTLLTFPSGYSISMGLIDDLEDACKKLQAG